MVNGDHLSSVRDVIGKWQIMEALK